MGAWGGQWNESDITGTCTLVSIFYYGCVHPAGLAEAHESEGGRGKVRLATQVVRSVAGSNGQSGLKSLGHLERVRSRSHWRDNTFVTFGIRLRTDMI